MEKDDQLVPKIQVGGGTGDTTANLQLPPSQQQQQQLYQHQQLFAQQDIAFPPLGPISTSTHRSLDNWPQHHIVAKDNRTMGQRSSEMVTSLGSLPAVRGNGIAAAPANNSNNHFAPYSNNDHFNGTGYSSSYSNSNGHIVPHSGDLVSSSTNSTMSSCSHTSSPNITTTAALTNSTSSLGYVSDTDLQHLNHTPNHTPNHIHHHHNHHRRNSHHNHHHRALRSKSSQDSYASMETGINTSKSLSPESTDYDQTMTSLLNRPNSLSLDNLKQHQQQQERQQQHQGQHFLCPNCKKAFIHSQEGFDPWFEHIKYCNE